jgi:hypothetical protein
VGDRVDRQVSQFDCSGYSVRDLLWRVQWPAVPGRLSPGRAGRHGRDIACPGARRYKAESLNSQCR